MSNPNKAAGISRNTAAATAGTEGVTIGRPHAGYPLNRLTGDIIGGIVVAAPIFSSFCFIFEP